MKNNKSEAEVGTFSASYLKDYEKHKRICYADVKKLNNMSCIMQPQAEQLLGHKIHARVFRLIKTYGLSIGAFLCKKIDWELVAIITGKPNYMKMMIDLDDNVQLQKDLSLIEAITLRTVANNFRTLLLISLKPPLSIHLHRKEDTLIPLQTQALFNEN